MKPIDVPLIGTSKNVPQDDPGYLLNLYAEEVSEKVFTLKPTPGTVLDAEVTSTPAGCRGQITIQGRYFVVVGALFLEKVGASFVNIFTSVPADPAPTPPCAVPSPFFQSTAVLSTTSGKVGMIANNPPGDKAQIMVVDDANGYVFELGANPGEGGWATAATMAARGFVGGNSQIAFCAGRAIAPKPGTAQWQFSKLYDFTNFCDSSDTGFATCTSLLNGELKAVSSNGELCYFFSETGFEMWKNVGRVPNPLQRVLSYDKIGIQAPHSAVFSGRSVYWLGGVQNGQGVVYRHTGGGGPERISDHTRERNIAKLAGPADAVGAEMQSLGHEFYILTFREGNRTFAYDAVTGMWHDRAQLVQPSGILLALPFVSIDLVDGKYLGIDYRDGKIWRIDDDVWEDDGKPIKRDLIIPPIPEEGTYLSYFRSVDFFCEVGNTPVNQDDPEIMFRYSTDRGQNWSLAESQPVGGNNSYETQLQFFGIGAAYTVSLRFTAVSNQYMSWRRARLWAE